MTEITEKTDNRVLLMNTIIPENNNIINTKPMVSVFCLAYNHKNSIAQAIESIVSQKTDFPFELIVHDDASTDNTAEIIKQYEEKYPHIIKPIYQTENQFFKCNLAKEYLLPKMQGKYVAICEGDDFWTDESKLQLQVDYMENNPECTMCFHAVEQLESDGTKTVYRPLKDSQKVPTQLIIKRGGMFCPSVSLMFRADVMTEWPEFRLVADVYDYPSQVLAAVKGESYYIDKIMGVYRFASEGSWTEQHKAVTDFKHTNNETRWLELFNEYTKGKYRAEIDYHMAHLWFTEYRKTIDKDVKKKAKSYINKLDFKNKMIFTVLVFMFSVLGTKANALWNIMKKYLLK